MIERGNYGGGILWYNDRVGGREAARGIARDGGQSEASRWSSYPSLSRILRFGEFTLELYECPVYTLLPSTGAAGGRSLGPKGYGYDITRS